RTCHSRLCLSFLPASFSHFLSLCFAPCAAPSIVPASSSRRTCARPRARCSAPPKRQQRPLPANSSRKTSSATVMKWHCPNRIASLFQHTSKILPIQEQEKAFQEPHPPRSTHQRDDPG